MSNREQITYVLDVKAEVAQAEQAVQGLKNAFDTVKLPVLKSTQISGQIQKLEDEIQNFKTLTEKNEVSLIDLKDIENSRKRIIKFVNDIRTTTRGFGDLFKINPTSLLPENIQSNIKKVTTAFEKLKKVNNEYNEQTKDSSTIIDDFNKRLKEQKKIAEDAQKKLDSYNKAQERINKYEAQIKNRPKVEEKLTSLEAEQTRRETQGRTDTKVYADTQEKIKKLREELTQTARAYGLLAIEQKRIKDFDKTGLEEQISLYDRIEKELKEYKQQLNNAKIANDEAFKEIKQSLTAVPGIDVAVINSIEDLEKQLKKLASTDIEKVEHFLDDLRSDLNSINQPINSFNKKIDEADEKIRELTESEQDLESFRKRLLYFFSIESIVDLFTQSVRRAYDTVKELDSSMKEIAVVSDYDISDMWSELPEFTKQANSLSVAIKDVYDATGLFVQQGS